MVRQVKATKLQPCSLRLQNYPSKPLDDLGVCTVKVTIKGNKVSLPLVVIKGDGISLLGRNWLEQIKLDWHEIAKINGITKPSYQKKLDDLLKQYEEIFRDELGKCKQIKAKLHVKPNTVPKFYCPRPIPLALKEKVEEDLNRLERLGVISKVETSEWATPTVPVRKPNGSVRLCGGYKVTINPYLNVNQYPLPRPEELFATLNNGQHFTKLDLSEAYLQIELDDDAKKYLVINTHKGLYRFNRLPYGIASTPAIFQQSIEQVLPKLPKVVYYMDDILITGRTDEEHLQNLTSVFESIRQHGLRIKLSKCKFFQESVEYLGHIVSKDGIHTSRKKIKAITDVPAPIDVSKLRSFLGMVNHYGKFVKSLTELIAPYHPRSNGKAEWFVQTFKNAIRRGKHVGVQKALCQFLLKYRSTPHPSTGETPSKLMFGREIRTRLHMLHPNEMEKPRQQETAKALTRTFKANDPVWVQNYTGKPKWLAGKLYQRQDLSVTK